MAAYSSIATITRPNNTTAYAANAVIGTTGNPGTGAAIIYFSSLGPQTGTQTLITSASFEIDDTAVISGETSYNLYLYNAAPPSNLNDGAAFGLASSDRASFLAKIPLGTPVSETGTLLIQTDQINKQITSPNGGVLYGYLVTVGAYTPIANRVYKITLHSVDMVY